MYRRLLGISQTHEWGTLHQAARPPGDEIEPYVQSLRSIPKSGMHNPLKNPER